MAYHDETRIYWRLWVYFKRGHSSYLGFFVGIVTFIIVFYKLFLDSIPALKPYFPSLWMFVIAFIIVYGSITVVLGWIDLKKGSYQTETKMTFDLHPRAKEQFDLIKDIDKRLQKIEKLMDKK